MKKVNCCYECQDRHIGCHEVCQKYINQLEEYIAEKREIKKMKNRETAVTTFAIDGIRKSKRRTGKKA